jgi:indolepyruvate ferredoxin oxidoreductase alpha subunit
MNKNIEALEALCHGLLDGGCNYVTNFPGFYSHDIFSMLRGKHIALNEKVAYEMGFGASLAGARTVVTFKSFGLNVAADPFLNSMVSGINAGLVVILTEDVEVAGSQCRQDSRYYRDFYGGLWFEPTNIQEAYQIAYNAFKWSEELDIPIVIRLTNQFFEISGEYERQKKQKYISRHLISCFLLGTSVFSI